MSAAAEKASFPSIADAWFQVRPGGDIAFIDGALKALDEEGGFDEAFLGAQVVGWEAVRQSWEQIFANTRWLRVTPTTVVCQIEAMKLFNEIQAECSGVIAEILVENQQPVEWGQVLFRVDPTG